MPRLKRDAATAELDISALEDPVPSEPALAEMLTRLRNMWEFASLMQYIYLFGGVVKISEDFDIEDLEQECLRSTPSEKLAAIGLALLKYVSSHRGLTPDIFAEYTRRQYLAKLPSENPFGDDEEPVSFDSLDIYTRIQVLQHLSTWTFNNPDRIRGLMPEDEDHLNWRMEPLGWDADDRAYFVLDDNRLYRRTDDPIPPPTPQPKARSKPSNKKKQKSKPPPPKPTRGTRASKRLRVDESEDEYEAENGEEPAEEVEDTVMADTEDSTSSPDAGYGFTAKTWECVAVTLTDYQDFLSSIAKSRDANEKQLRRRVEEDVLPIIEKRAEAIRQKQLKKLREEENLHKLASAKRSGRLAEKASRQAEEEEQRQADLKRQADLRMAREEQERQRRIEEGHESRRLTREHRLKEREVKRILHEEELARLDREASAVASQQGATPDPQSESDRKRLSSRNLQNQQEAHRKELERLTQDQEEDKWYFDCVVCGQHGENIDDGSHSVACERCNVWQHSGCHGLTPERCEDENFHFICSSCRKKEQADAEKAKSGITIKIGKQTGEDSAREEKPMASKDDTIAIKPIKKEHALPDYVQRQLDGLAQRTTAPGLQSQPQLPPVQQQHRPPQPAQSIPPYQPRGFAGTPPDRVQQHIAAQNTRVPIQAMTQHDWIHYNAVNQTMNQHPLSQQSLTNGSATAYAPTSYIPPQQRPPSSADQIANHASPGTQVTGDQHLTPSMSSYGSYTGQQRPLQAVAQSSQQGSSPPQVARPVVQQNPHTNGSLQATAQRDLYVHNSQAISTPQRSPLQPQGPMPTGLAASPQTFVPPSTSYNRQAAVSPVKSSPPRPVAASPLAEAHKLNAPGSFSSISASPSASFEHVPKLSTPSKPTEVTVSPINADSATATNGMRGPWPDSSLSIPQKNASPPPPPSAPAILQ